LTGLTYEVMKTAEPRIGFRGVENTDEMAA
jgi:hypothetical protein